MDESRSFSLTERPEIPWLSVVLGYGPMVPLIVGAAASWVFPPPWQQFAESLTLVYAASILAFLAGVRRGLSFRTKGGPRVSQIATMFSLYLLALVSFAALRFRYDAIAAAATLIGFFAVMILDPIAARRGTAPLFFARLRPTQMPLAVASLAALLAYILRS